MTTAINTAGEIELKELGVDDKHLKFFSAVRPEKMILNNPPDFGAPDFGRKNIPEAAGPFDGHYIEGGLSIHSQEPKNWSIATENTDWLAVVTWDDAGQSNQFQIGLVRDWPDDVTRIYMRGLATWNSWGPWVEITAIPVIQSDLSDLETEVGGLSNDLDDHDVATTDVHGIEAPDAIESEAGAQAKADVVQGNLDDHAGTDAGAETRGHVLEASHVANVSGGTVQDVNARAAINNILAALQAAGIMAEGE